jgi:hypothetical protein
MDFVLHKSAGIHPPVIPSKRFLRPSAFHVRAESFARLRFSQTQHSHVPNISSFSLTPIQSPADLLLLISPQIYKNEKELLTEKKQNMSKTSHNNHHSYR